LTRFTAGMKGKDAYNPDAQIVIGNRQYIFKNRDRLKKVDVLIVDEVHTAAATSTEDFINSLNCKIKVGCSGTLPRDKHAKWKLEGMFGKTVYTEDITSLQERGYISKLKITLLKIKDNVVAADKNILFNLETTRKYRPDEFGNSDILFDEAYKAEHEYF
jgi:superfamily II DNA or RNA helicase